MAPAEARVTVEHEKGLHARPASRFVETASTFESEITVQSPDEETADAKSSLGIMSLGVDTGDEILIRAEGPDSQEAVDALVELIEDGFGLDDGDDSG